VKRLAALACMVLSCSTFEDPSVIIDLRVIGMTATPAEQVVDVDVSTTILDLRQKLEPTFVCAFVAEPGRAGPLRWSMTACLIDNGACDSTRPSFVIGAGETPDPESSPAPICAPINPNADLLAILADSFETDPFRGLDGIPYAIELRVGAPDEDPELDQTAFKELRVRPRLPEDRTPNQNPTLSGVQIVREDQTAEFAVIAHCATNVPHSRRPAGSQSHFTLGELPTTRETYSAGTLMGTFETFEETIRYQWLTTAGSLSFGETGGPRDFAGNIPPTGNNWRAPVVDHPTDVQLWLIQRDERGGNSVYPICIEVVP
jgi:hypothetical protein